MTKGKPEMPSNPAAPWLRDKRLQLAWETKVLPAHCLFIAFGILSSSLLEECLQVFLLFSWGQVLIYFQYLFVISIPPTFKDDLWGFPTFRPTMLNFWLIAFLLSLPVWNQSMLMWLTDWKHQLICSQLEIKVDGLDLVSRDTCHQILVGNSAL